MEKKKARKEDREGVRSCQLNLKFLQGPPHP